MMTASCVLAVACGKTVSQGEIDSKTHWLLRCSTDAECGSLECLCDVCTKPCTEPLACPNAAVAECRRSSASGCGESEPMCVAPCKNDRDCDAARAGLLCIEGQCQPEQSSAGAGGSTGGCDSIPQCDFSCPEGTVNPVDESGCQHTCECVPAGRECSNEPPCGSQCPPGTVSPRDESGCITGCTCIPDPSSADAGGRCDDIPACRFACPEGTVNPVDGNGCTHTCECVFPGTPPDSLRLFHTCGDPVCGGYTGGSGAPLCSTEQVGDVCRVAGSRCDPQDSCNSLIVCASSDPALAPGGCPISRRRYKTDIHYLSRDELAQYQKELLEMKLATWRYKQNPSKQRLGFIIDDNEGSAAVDPARDMVDLYGYTSMAVAVIQLQAQKIEALERDVAEMKKAKAATGHKADSPGRP
jgi:hypothetical protein